MHIGMHHTLHAIATMTNFDPRAYWNAPRGYYQPPPMQPPTLPGQPKYRRNRTARIVTFTLLGFMILIGGCVALVVHSIDNLHFNLHLNFPAYHTNPSLYGMNVAISPNGTAVYVTVPSKDLLDVYSANNGTLTGKIPVGQTPTGLAVNPNGRQIWVANTSVSSLEKSLGQTGGSVSVVEASTNRVIANIPLPGGPIDVAFSPNGSTAYVTVNGVLNEGYVAVINTSTFDVTDKLLPTLTPSSTQPPTPSIATAASSPSHLPAGTARGTTAAAAATVVPSQSNTQGCFTPNSAGCWHPTSVSVTPNGSEVWVSEAYAVTNLSLSGPDSANYSDYVYVFNTITGQEIADIKVGNGAFFMAMSKDGRYVYVADKVSCSVDEISTATFEVIASVRAPVGDGCPYGIAASATDSVAYTVTGNDRTVNTGKEGNMLEVVDFTTGKMTMSREAGSDPVTVTLSPGGNSIYIADAKSPTIMVISTSTYTTTMIIHLPVTPSAHSSGSTHLK